MVESGADGFAVRERAVMGWSLGVEMEIDDWGV